MLTGFLRISTNRRVFNPPLTLEQACGLVQIWLDQPCARTVCPTTDHWEVFRELLRAGQATANLVADAHLAALAIEYGCELYSTDSDFARFPGLRWRNPLPARLVIVSQAARYSGAAGPVDRPASRYPPPARVYAELRGTRTSPGPLHTDPLRRASIDIRHSQAVEHHQAST